MMKKKAKYVQWGFRAMRDVEDQFMKLTGSSHVQKENFDQVLYLEGIKAMAFEKFIELRESTEDKIDHAMTELTKLINIFNRRIQTLA